MANSYFNEEMTDAMKKAVDKVLDKICAESCIVNITMEFTSKTQKEFKVFVSREIKSLKIHQDYVQNYTDKITGELELEVDAYQTLYFSRKDLSCTLNIFKVSPEQQIEPQYKEKPEISEKFKVVLPNAEDLYKKFPQLRPDPKKRAKNYYDDRTYNLQFELIPEDVYKARKEQLHGLFRKVNIDEMIRYAISYFGFKKGMVSPPANKFKYLNFLIPPAIGVDKIMSFFQNAEALGVYSEGFNSYISQGCWYVYPRYGEPIKKKKIHVYSIGPNKYQGMNQYHWKEDEDCTHVICNSEMEEKKWSDVGSENEPTAICSQISDAVLDATRKLIADDKWKILSRNSFHAAVPCNPIDMENYIRIKFDKTHTNEFVLNSSVTPFQGSTYTFEWERALPWTFHPATLVQIHYDEHKEYKTVDGMCEGATYEFTPEPNTNMCPKWNCKAQMTINVPYKKAGSQY